MTATGIITFNEERAREALRVAGIGTSDCCLSRRGDLAWELRSPRGALIATVTTSGTVTTA